MNLNTIEDYCSNLVVVTKVAECLVIKLT